MIRCKTRSGTRRSQSKKKSEDMQEKRLRKASYCGARPSQNVQKFLETYKPRARTRVETWRRGESHSH